MTYKVLVDQNSHYMDESERYELGEFETFELACQAAEDVINRYLESTFRPGMSAEALFKEYTLFGEDPFIVPISETGEAPSFSAWDYAKTQSGKLCHGAGA